MSDGSILIFHAGALGDFVLTFALPMALKLAYPGTAITYVTHPSKGQLAERFVGTGSANLDGMGWHSLHGDAPHLDEPASELLGKAEACYSFLGGDLFAANIRRR